MFAVAVKPSPMKNYYTILNVDPTATPEQIKVAYRESVKKYHPDVVDSESPSGEMFRDVNEAYGVLSMGESRASYDILRTKNPHLFDEVSEAVWNKSNRPDLRDKMGNTPTAADAAESYAAERKAELARQRKYYNVNHLGFYRGGVPRKGKGVIRGRALGNIGYFHQPEVHNYLQNYH